VIEGDSLYVAHQLQRAPAEIYERIVGDGLPIAGKFFSGRHNGIRQELKDVFGGHWQPLGSLAFGGHGLARRQRGFRVRHGTADLSGRLVLAQTFVDNLACLNRWSRSHRLWASGAFAVQ
jgi:hypothetical protein